jgi:hypothetical protein
VLDSRALRSTFEHAQNGPSEDIVYNLLAVTRPAHPLRDRRTWRPSHHPDTVLFAFGWAAARQRNLMRRCMVSVLTGLTNPGFFGRLPLRIQAEGREPAAYTAARSPVRPALPARRPADQRLNTHLSGAILSACRWMPWQE